MHSGLGYKGTDDDLETRVPNNGVVPYLAPADGRSEAHAERWVYVHREVAAKGSTHDILRQNTQPKHLTPAIAQGYRRIDQGFRPLLEEKLLTR